METDPCGSPSRPLLWKLTTALFATTTLVLLVDVAWRDPVNREAAAPPEVRAARPAAPAPDVRATSFPEPIEGPEAPAAPSEVEIRDSLRRLARGVRGGSRTRSIDVVLAGGEASVPRLEALIRFARDRGGHCDGVLDAYARVLGVRALPLLRDTLLDPDDRIPSDTVLGAIGLIDDPAAAEVVREWMVGSPRVDGRLAEWVIARASQTPSWLPELLREVVRSPGVNVLEGTLITFRRDLFALGTWEDRGRLWPGEELFERTDRILWLVGLVRNGGDCPDVWRRRLKESLLRPLDGEDEKWRRIAASQIPELPADFWSPEERERLRTWFTAWDREEGNRRPTLWRWPENLEFYGELERVIGG